MINVKSVFLSIAGVLFTYHGLKGDFVLHYNGSALIMAWTSFFLAIIESRKRES
ncbi:hypothetical protein ACOCEA_05875 [Maribacter sp. CXY002]|uniref:hypothetical protein n=1 Tax=Maribacter luteocoastalis TaxID=3407671 RepID=UPI003B66E890